MRKIIKFFFKPIILTFVIYIVSFASSVSATATKEDKIMSPIDLDLFLYTGQHIDWNIVANRLQDTGENVRYYGIHKAFDLYLKQGFDTREGVEGLYQSRKRVLMRIGALAPRLDINFGSSLPMGINDFTSNLLGFVIPFNWFKWMEARQFYDARKNAYLNTLLDQSSFTQITYFRIHQAKIDYEISLFYKQRLTEMLTHFREEYEEDQNGPINITDVEFLDSLNAAVNGTMYELRQEALASIPQLGTLMGFIDKTGNIDIERLELPSMVQLSPLDKNKIIAKAKSNSLEIKSMEYMIKAAQYTLKAAIVSPLSTGEPDEDFRTFGLSFGLDNLANIQISESQIRLLEIQKERSISLIDNIVSNLVFRYNESLDDYHDAEKKLESDNFKVQRALQNSIRYHNQNNGIDFEPELIGIALATLLRINRIRHDLLIYKNLIDRYCVYPQLERLKQKLPVVKELEFLRDWATEETKPKKKKKKKAKFIKKYFYKIFNKKKRNL